MRKRRRIETVAGKLVELYRAKRVWARDRWRFPLAARIFGHTMSVYLCQQAGFVLPVRFSELRTSRNPLIGLPDAFRVVVLCGETTALEGRRVSC